MAKCKKKNKSMKDDSEEEDDDDDDDDEEDGYDLDFDKLSKKNMIKIKSLLEMLQEQELLLEQQ
jgi:uncharacterized protein YjaZ